MISLLSSSIRSGGIRVSIHAVYGIATFSLIYLAIYGSVSFYLDNIMIQVCYSLSTAESTHLPELT